jgi:hypothetical protein
LWWGKTRTFLEGLKILNSISYRQLICNCFNHPPIWGSGNGDSLPNPIFNPEPTLSQMKSELLISQILVINKKGKSTPILYEKTFILNSVVIQFS